MLTRTIEDLLQTALIPMPEPYATMRRVALAQSRAILGDDEFLRLLELLEGIKDDPDLCVGHCGSYS